MNLSVRCEPVGENGHVKATVYKLNGAGSAVEVHQQEINPEIEAERQGFGANAAEALHDPGAAKGIVGQIVEKLGEIRTAIAARGKAATRRNVRRPTRPKISNVVDRTYTVRNKRGEDEQHNSRHYKSIVQIGNEIQEATGGWPKVAGGLSFGLREEKTNFPTPSSIRWLGKVPDLFAFLGQKNDIRWASGDVTDEETGEILNPHTKEDLLSHIQATAPQFRSVEIFPHYPPVEGVFYLPWELPSFESLPVPSPLNILIGRLNADAEIDRSLLHALMLTLAWGGPPGARPAFVISSPHPGKGQGKSQTAGQLAEIFGGPVIVSAFEDADRIRSRLLSDDAVVKRSVLYDNAKGKIHGADVEQRITAKIIDGHKMYHGQATRLNLLTNIFTGNSPSLSQDLADRAVPISIGRQKRTDFVSWAGVFIPQHRAEIISELLHDLAAPPACSIEKDNRDRWSAWQDAILTRFENGNEIAAEIIRRRPSLDSDLDDANDIGQVVLSMVSKIIGFEKKVIKITRQQLHLALVNHGVIDKKMIPPQVTGFVKERLGIGECKRLFDRRTKTDRYWIYVGEEADSEDDETIIQ